MARTARAASASKSFDPPAACRAHVAGSFRDPLGFQQTDSGQYFVFDRRAHAVYTDRRRRGEEDRRYRSPSPDASSIRPPSTSTRPTAASSSPTRRCGGRGCRSSRRTAGASAASRCRKPRSRGSNSSSVVLNGIGSIQVRGRQHLHQPARVRRAGVGARTVRHADPQRSASCAGPDTRRIGTSTSR